MKNSPPVTAKIAVHQMCSRIDPLANCADMVSAIGDAGRKGVDFYFAPEMSLLLDRDRKRSAEHIFAEEDTETINRIREAAAKAGIWVHLGSLPVRMDADSERLANRTLLINDKGEICARYDKIHLFDVQLSTGESWRESSIYDAGQAVTLVRTPLGLMGLSICYDMRFPDLYSAFGKAGAEILTIPAAFTKPTGEAHWHALLRARAIEQQCFVIATAQSGQHEDGRETYGHSLVIDPWGEVLLDMGEGEGLGFTEIDLGRIAEVRAQIPVHENRRILPDEVKRY